MGGDFGAVGADDGGPRVRLLLDLYPGPEPGPTGSLARIDSQARPFHGWLEFMALLDQLRSEATPGEEDS
jgi:hypothetical protein